jgi:hypothetical protein
MGPGLAISLTLLAGGIEVNDFESGRLVPADSKS